MWSKSLKRVSLIQRIYLYSFRETFSENDNEDDGDEKSFIEALLNELSKRLKMTKNKDIRFLYFLYCCSAIVLQVHYEIPAIVRKSH